MSSYPYSRRSAFDGLKGSLIRRLAPLVIGLLFAGFFVIKGCEQGPFGRRQIVAIGLPEESQLGAQAFQEVLRESQVDRDPAVNEAVGRVAKNLIRVTGSQAFTERTKLPPRDFEWKLSVVRSPQVNAFCLPGGKIVVYTGILPVAETEAGLAVVMGHEIGHALARHGSERMAHQKLVGIGQMAAVGSVSDLDPAYQRQLMMVFNAGAKYGVLLPYSRDHESEADKIGLYLMAAAGYDPANAPKFWQRMMAVSGGKAPPEFASTHPGHERRVAQLQLLLQEVRPIYEASPRLRDGDRRLPPA